MFNISELLSKFKSLPNPVEDKKIVADIVSSHIGSPVEYTQVSFKSNKIHLIIHPALKNIVYIKKQEILKQIQEKLKKQPIIDII